MLARRSASQGLSRAGGRPSSGRGAVARVAAGNAALAAERGAAEVEDPIAQLLGLTQLGSESGSGGGRSEQAAYTVRPGDTLSAIAAERLGEASRWPEIVSLNGIANPDSIFPGQVIRLPGSAIPTGSVDQASESTTPPGDTGVAEDGSQTEAGKTSEIVFKRKNIDLGGEDKYGHWWTEIDEGSPGQYAESYGWWPKGPVGLKDTLLGTDGELNGQSNFGGTPTRDPHHGDSADATFYADVSGTGKSVDTAMDEIRDFAVSYSGEWRWTMGAGQNCHTFQEQMISAVGLTLST